MARTQGVALVRVAFLTVGTLVLGSGPVHAQCRPGDILIGETATSYICRNPDQVKCIAQVGKEFPEKRKRSCSLAVGKSFKERKAQISDAAAICLVGCLIPDKAIISVLIKGFNVTACASRCAIAAEIVGLYKVVDSAADAANICQEQALRQQRKDTEDCER